ncbi:MAG TPA: hypothetical protein VML01_08380 [Bryobacterales bacterium]|nr:hypothetical protein [Bryobacterales bacterium]
MTEDHRKGSNPLFSRRAMLGMSGAAALAGMAAGGVSHAQQKRPRIACVVTYWAAPGSHADWIITKLLDGYWWKGAHVDSRVDVVSAYIHQLELSGLGRKVCAAKRIPIFDKVSDALTLGGEELAVDGVVLVGEHGVYHDNLKGQTYYPRWWLYEQIIRVFEQSKRSVPVFNDKHLSNSWDEAKWMFDKSRELDFPLYGGSSIPFYYRKPEIEIDADTPIKTSVVVGGSRNDGGLFHAVDVLQCFVERRKGGETGIEAVQCIHGPEVWKWPERNPWAGNLLDAVEKRFDMKPGQFRETSRRGPSVTIVDYRDGTKAAVFAVRGAGWTYAGDIEGQKDPTIISMLGWPGPYAQYHAANAFEHWLIEMMLTRKEPYNAERLLLSTGIVSFNMESNWENGRYSEVGRRVETPFMNMSYRSTRGPQFNTGPRPPVVPYLRGFEK